MLANCIDPLVKDFEGQQITVERLNNVRIEQMAAQHPWPKNSGYLSYITDDRNKDYWRPYIGQSENPHRRISQHVKAIMSNSTETLHYYIMAKGTGYRAANFLRLWTLIFPDKDNTDRQVPVILTNILEMFMSRAFQSLAPSILAPSILKKYFGEGNYSGTGLDIIPPLLQGLSLAPTIRHQYSLHSETSPDLEIQEWPKIRQVQRDRKEQDEATPLSQLRRDQYPILLRAALEDQLDIIGINLFNWESSLIQEREPVNLQVWLKSCEKEIKFATGKNKTLVLPSGTPRAQIGIIFDNHMLVNRSNIQQYTPPWGIRESGFSESNSLIWPYKLQQDRISKASSYRVQHLQLEEARIIQNFTRKLIQASNLTVILLCGVEAVDYLSTLTDNHIKLVLRGFTFDTYLEIDNRTIQRIYIIAPETLSAVWTNNWRQAIKISEVFRFAATLTSCSGIYPNFFDSTHSCLQIIRQYDREQNGNGQEKLTSKTVSDGIKAWLYRKGFRTMEDIERLEMKGESLTASLLMLMQILPRYPRQRIKRQIIPKSTTRKSQGPNLFSESNLNSIRELYEELNQKWMAESMITNASTTSISETNTSQTGLNRLETMSPELDECDTIELDELGEIVAATEPDRVKSTGLSRFKRNLDSLLDQIELKVENTRVSLSNGRLYKGEQDTRGMRLLIHSTLRLYLSDIWKEDNPDGVVVKAEIPGERHPKAWATDASEEDPAARVAFQVKAKRKNDEEVILYPQRDGWENVYKCNAFADWMEGDSDEALEFFVGGAYTNVAGIPFKPESRKKRKREADSPGSEDEQYDGAIEACGMADWDEETELLEMLVRTDTFVRLQDGAIL